jgi:tetratricopeptide (TPR) repeat protein
MTARGLASKRRAVAAAPSIESYADLARGYASLNDYSGVVRTCEEGLQHFPSAGELKRLRRMARAAILGERVSEIRDELNAAPRPGLYRELAETYLELGDLARCESVCVQWTARFPQDDGARLALARARIRRFYQERNAGDGLGAIELLNGVCERDPQNAKALRLLAELATRVGSYEVARETLARLLELIPGEPTLEGWYRRVNDESEGAPDLLQAIRDVELNGRFPGLEQRAHAHQEDAPTADANGQVQRGSNLRADLDQIAALKSAGRVAYLRGSTALVRGAAKGSGDPFARMTRSLTTIARRSTRRMGFGSFSAGFIESPQCKIVLVAGHDNAAAAETAPAARPEPFLDALRDLVSRQFEAERTDA